MKPLSYDAAWTDLSSMARMNGTVLLTMAGAFLLLPGFAQALWAPAPEIRSLDWNGMKQLNDYLRENFLTLLLCQLPIWLGSAAILALLLDSRRPTVAEALKGAGALLLSVVLLNWISQFLIFTGFLLLVVPGIYLIGRLTAAGPAQMAERIVNPVAPMGRSFELTRGNGWRVAGLVIIVAIVAAIAGMAINTVLGVLVRAMTPEATASVFEALVRATITAATTLLMLLLSAAVYRQLSSTSPWVASS